MGELLETIAGFIWSYPVVGLCLFSAIYFTARLGFVQLRAIPHAVMLLTGRYDDPDEKGSISHFQALSAALSGTIGIGNIAGVAVAIGVGGPGAVLWMWIIGLFGMATKYVECTLGTHYRDEDPATGETFGGPMLYITRGLGDSWKPMATLYALTIALAGFGFSCMFQSNQAASALEANFAVPRWAAGVALTVLVGATIIGGITRIGAFAARVVPLMTVTYVVAAVGICVWHLDQMPAVIRIIVEDGLTGRAAAGGSIVAVAMWGVRRAIFSNEAGLGSAAIAHAAVKTRYPVREGIVASLGPMIDTIIVSGATASIIVLGGAYGAEMPRERGEVASFESIPESIPEGWAWTSELPAESESLRVFHGGEAALVASGAPEDVDPLAVELSDGIGDGIRFAYHAEGAPPFVQLRDAGGRVLADVLDPDAQPDEVDPIPGLLPRDCDAQGRWQACLLVPNEPLAAELKDLEDAKYVVEIRPGDGAPVYVDRVSSVDTLEGIALTSIAFDHYLPGFGWVFISVAGFLFALSTMVTWSYYGETAMVSIVGSRARTPYRIIFALLAFVGAVFKLGVVISLSDALVGLLVIPNTIALLMLSPQVAAWSREYFADLRAGKFEPKPD